MHVSYELFKESLKEKIFYPKIRTGLTYDDVVELIEDFLIQNNYDWREYHDILKNLSDEQCQAITSYYFQCKIDNVDINSKFERVLKSLNIIK